MIRVILQMFMIAIIFGAGSYAPALAQNLFVTPNKDKSEKATPGIVLKPRAKSRYDDRSPTPKKRKVFKKKVQKDNPDFDVFKKVKGLDLDLMRAGGRAPTTQEELRLMSAAYSMPQVSSALEMKRKGEAKLLAQMASSAKKNVRTDYLKSVAEKNRRIRAAEKVKAEAANTPAQNSSPKIFNNYR